MTQSYSESEDFFLLRCAIAANDEKFELWPAECVEYARRIFKRSRGSTPSIEQIIKEIGSPRMEQLVQQVLAQRKFKNQLLGYRCSCHYCGSDDDLVHSDFALMMDTERRFSFGGTVASAAISAITLPLIGAAALRLPGRSNSGAALRLRLVTCKSCRKKHGNFFGLYLLNERHASNHPLWTTLHEQGFAKFLMDEKMPDEFKYSIASDL